MDKKLQDKFRDEMVLAYQSRAFEALANYDYFGDRYSEIDKQVKGFEDRIAAMKTEFLKLDEKKPEERAKRKMLKGQMDSLRKQIEQVTPGMKKYWESVVRYQQDGMQLLQQIEHFKTFKIRTPDEIDEAKKKPEAAAAEPMVAGAEAAAEPLPVKE